MTTATRTSTTPDDRELSALEGEIRAYVENEGERWADRIERERAVPLELWDDLRDRGYLRLAAPSEYGGRGIALPRYLELLEILAMSHGSLRMIVHVCNGIWRPIAAHATAEQRERFLLPLVAGGSRSRSRSPSRTPAPAPTCAARSSATATPTTSAARST